MEVDKTINKSPEIRVHGKDEEQCRKNRDRREIMMTGGNTETPDLGKIINNNGQV